MDWRFHTGRERELPSKGGWDPIEIKKFYFDETPDKLYPESRPGKFPEELRNYSRGQTHIELASDEAKDRLIQAPYLEVRNSDLEASGL